MSTTCTVLFLAHSIRAKHIFVSFAAIQMRSREKWNLQFVGSSQLKTASDLFVDFFVAARRMFWHQVQSLPDFSHASQWTLPDRFSHRFSQSCAEAKTKVSFKKNKESSKCHHNANYSLGCLLDRFLGTTIPIFLFNRIEVQLLEPIFGTK